MDIFPEGNCIYCNTSTDFTDEHVFPAGMGGDDRNYLLKAGVCGHCNTKVFSQFEATLMRRSIVALARAINQPKSRNGKNSTYDPIEANIIDDDGRRLESNYTEGFKAEVLPQLIYNGETIDSAATKKEDLYTFIDELIDILQEETISLIEKKAQKSKNKYIISRYHLAGPTYVLREKQGIERPPKKCLWIQYQTSKSNEAVASPRIYRRAKGQIVVKISDLSGIGVMLFKIKATLPSILKSSVNIDEEEHSTPLVTTTCLGWSSECDRAIAKLGVNLLAFQEGLDVARHSSLDPIKKFILHGTPSHRVGFLTREEHKLQPFGVFPEGNHCIALSVSKNLDGTLTANISMFLYGSTGLGINLCNNGVTREKLTINYYLVDYLKNSITKYSFMEYQRLYNSSFIDEFAKANMRNFFRF